MSDLPPMLEARPLSPSRASGPCRSCAAGSELDERRVWGLSGEQVDQLLGQLSSGKCTIGRQSYGGIPCVSLPAPVRLFLKKAWEGAKLGARAGQGKLVFTLHPLFTLMHTAHWDVDGWLPWVDLNKRSVFAKEVSLLLSADGEINNNIKQELSTKKLPKHARERWEKGSFPAALEYSIPSLGVNTRLVLMYEADCDAPLVVFLTSHYGSGQTQSQKMDKVNPFWVVTGIEDDLIASADKMETSCCEEGTKLLKTARGSLLVVSAVDMTAWISPTNLRRMFPSNWVPPREDGGQQLFQCVSTDFFTRFSKTLGINFQDIFGGQVKWQGSIGFIEPADGELPQLPEFHISVRTASGSDNYYDIHFTWRPSFRYFTQKYGSFPAKQMGVPTTYLFYRIFWDFETHQFVLYNKDRLPSAFAGSKINLAVGWVLCRHAADKKPETLESYDGMAIISDCIEKLNFKASKAKDLEAQIKTSQKLDK
ncbi:MAG TPA: hypothetical protein VI299_00010 [Polyangiales bacterium]